MIAEQRTMIVDLRKDLDNYKEILAVNIDKKFGLKGKDIVDNNIACVNEALENLVLYNGDFQLYFK